MLTGSIPWSDPHARFGVRQLLRVKSPVHRLLMPRYASQQPIQSTRDGLFCAQPTLISVGRLRAGGEMILKIAVVLLIAWVLGLLGLYRIGDLVHILLLVGVMLLLVGFLRVRDAIVPTGSGPGRRSKEL
jgi:hypothetical protein